VTIIRPRDLKDHQKSRSLGKSPQTHGGEPDRQDQPQTTPGPWWLDGFIVR
jgi:hypothetical protein